MLRIAIAASLSLLVIALSSCGGGSGGGGNGPSTGVSLSAPGGQLNVLISSVTINSAPVVKFQVTDQSGAAVPGLTATDLRFNVAKLLPGANGEPSRWQSYINRAVNGAVRASQERKATGYAFGNLTNDGNGNYTYTFATDITSASANPCPAPCTDADGKALNVGYEPGLTHRVSIQQGNSAYAKASGIYDFVPAGGAPSKRDVVLNATCNECHHQLTAHGTRVDTNLCVTCHNPGTWIAGTPNTPVDFKVMIHRIHYNNAGNQLPSVMAGTPYTIGSNDFSAVVFPQDVRNCTRCHDGKLSAQGDNWKNQPSIAACSSCHDNVYFGTQPDAARPYQTVAHPGGVQADDSTCALCHGPGRVADVTVAHNLPDRLKAAAAKFKFNILNVTPTSAGSKPVVTFSVTDPTNGDAPYDIKANPAFTAGAASTLNVKLGWSTSGRADIGNDGSGQNYGQPVNINALTAAVPGATSGTYTVTSPIAIPAGQTGSLRVFMDGHPAGAVTTPGSYTDRLAARSVFQDFPISSGANARRQVVDVAKCDTCHGTLSLHGANRNEEPAVCVACHNPNATDKGRRTGTGVDGKTEESIDFKTMIHAIHAGQASKGGFRDKGIVVYGYGGTPNDFSDVVFPGKLSKCTACHTDTSYQLIGAWAAPTANGILGSTSNTGASPTDPADNLRSSPTASVCASCHDGKTAHMSSVPGPAQFNITQSGLDTSAEEGCVFCHGPSGPWDIKKMHGVQ